MALSLFVPYAPRARPARLTATTIIGPSVVNVAHFKGVERLFDVLGRKMTRRFHTVSGNWRCSPGAGCGEKGRPF